MLHFSPECVKNLYEEPVTDSQYESRAMLKSFTVAASKATAQFGPNVKELDHPIVIQTIQCDGQRFQFSLFQLNTLDLDNYEGKKNYWYTTEYMNLYEQCAYVQGKPILEGYNRDILKHMFLFYNNS